MLDVLIVGGGSIGERHLRCFGQLPDCRVSLCEVHETRRASLVDQYRPHAAFSRLEDAAAQQWHAAIVCTPAHLHVSHTLQLACCTSAFLIEKPLATSVQDAARLEALATERPVAVAYVLRVHPAVETVRAELAAGRIGDLLQVAVVSGQHFPTYRPAYREIYYRDRATGGGAVQDAATHVFNLVQHLAGDFTWIACDCAHQALEGVEVEDTVHLLGRTMQRVLVSVSLNQFMAPNELIVYLNGSRGTLQLRLHEQRWGRFCHDDSGWHWSEPLVSERDELFRRQAAQFLAVCRGQAFPMCDLAAARHTLDVNLAALASGGNRVELPSR